LIEDQDARHTGRGFAQGGDYQSPNNRGEAMKIEKIVLDNFMQHEGPKVEKTSTSFSEILKDSINKVGELEKDANEQAEKLVKMEDQDIHNTMIAVEKADLSFQLMMQIRNKIISAYEEIMRIQV
jgi:flagellar hook-basal body complex protein FliE